MLWELPPPLRTLWLISEGFPLWLKSPKKGAKSIPWASFFYVGSAQGRDFSSMFGDLCQSRKLSKIKLYLTILDQQHFKDQLVHERKESRDKDCISVDLVLIQIWLDILQWNSSHYLVTLLQSSSKVFNTLELSLKKNVVLLSMSFLTQYFKYITTVWKSFLLGTSFGNFTAVLSKILTLTF